MEHQNQVFCGKSPQTSNTYKPATSAMSNNNKNQPTKVRANNNVGSKLASTPATPKPGSVRTGKGKGATVSIPNGTKTKLDAKLIGQVPKSKPDTGNLECGSGNCPPPPCPEDCPENYRDCNSVCGGGAYLDCNGHCCAGTTGTECAVADCMGVCGGTAVKDCAGVCGGNSVPDCNGVCNGNSVPDCAGVCNGPNKVDCAGVCGGCASPDCNGVCNGNATFDCDGVCAGTHEIDCSGECCDPFGQYDGPACQSRDCMGVCGGCASRDCAGVCDGDHFRDCAGHCQSPCGVNTPAPAPVPQAEDTFKPIVLDVPRVAKSSESGVKVDLSAPSKVAPKKSTQDKKEANKNIMNPIRGAPVKDERARVAIPSQESDKPSKTTFKYR